MLLDRLVEAARAPKFAEGADVSAAEALPGLVQRPWDHLTKAVAQLDDDPSYEHLHEIRIRAKRVRYAAEAATLALPEAQTMATTAAAVQEVLGEQHDADRRGAMAARHRGDERDARRGDGVWPADRSGRARRRGVG